MQIEKLRIGSTVRYPSDRGEPAGVGKIEHVSSAVYKNVYGNDYVWVLVRYESGRSASWPSNRLGRP